MAITRLQDRPYIHFDVEVTEKREATKDEIVHGHAHSVGGHHH